jgi:hypothetical protein
VAGGVFARFGPGRAGASGANAAYITRGRATGWDERAVAARNYPAEVGAADDYRDLREQLEEYAAQQEAHELARPRRGGGETRTHYRGVLSFEGKVETARAREMASAYLAREFPDARAIAAVHQDTEHTHVHLHVQARAVDDHKLHFDRGTYGRLDEAWAEVYARAFGREKLEEHLAKKAETAEWKRAYARARANGHQPPPAPERTEHQARPDELASREEHACGVDEARVGGDQRGAAAADPRAHGRGREPEGGERALEEQLERTAGRAGGAVRAADAAVRTAQELADRAPGRDRLSDEPERDR